MMLFRKTPSGRWRCTLTRPDGTAVNTEADSIEDAGMAAISAASVQR